MLLCHSVSWTHCALLVCTWPKYDLKATSNRTFRLSVDYCSDLAECTLIHSMKVYASSVETFVLCQIPFNLKSFRELGPGSVYTCSSLGQSVHYCNLLKTLYLRNIYTTAQAWQVHLSYCTQSGANVSVLTENVHFFLSTAGVVNCVKCNVEVVVCLPLLKRFTCVFKGIITVFVLF